MAETSAKRYCLRCGYLLQGLKLDALGRGICPECGNPFYGNDLKSSGPKVRPKGGAMQSTIWGFALGCMIFICLVIAFFKIAVIPFLIRNM